MEYRGKKVLVVGLARSGIAAAQLLAKHGALVTVNDSKAREKLPEAARALADWPVSWAVGREGEKLLDGQDVLVVSPGVPLEAPVIREAKAMGIYVIGELELAAQCCTGRLAAITGTNGKTTTTTLLYEMFRAAGWPAHAVGNIGYPFSQAVMEAGPDDAFACECSSFQMETIDTFRPRAAALLNITEDHLNRHHTMAEYTRLKMRVFENQDAEDAAIFNADDPALRGLDSQVRSRRLFFSRRREVDEGACVRGGVLVYRQDGHETEICRPEEIRIPGPHNLENALAAVCLGMRMDVPAEAIARTLRDFPGVEHRIEFVRELDGVRYINDSKGTNVDSTVRAVQTMDRPTVIILGGSDKGCDFVPLIREMQANPLIREAVLIGATAEKIEDAMRRCGWQAIHHAADMGEAVRMGRSLSAEGWNVLLSPSCASFDMFTDFEHRGRVFKEQVWQLH